MPGSASLLPVRDAHRPVVERLWQLYRHDMSEFWGSMPDDEGLYQPGRLPAYFGDPDRCGYLIVSDSGLAGLALIRGLSGEPRVVGDFFVVRAARRKHVGACGRLAVARLAPGALGDCVPGGEHRGCPLLAPGRGGRGGGGLP